MNSRSSKSELCFTSEGNSMNKSLQFKGGNVRAAHEALMETLKHLHRRLYSLKCDLPPRHCHTHTQQQTGHQDVVRARRPSF